MLPELRANPAPADLPRYVREMEPELAQVRTLEGLKEKGPGIFYFKSVPFLHFHEKEGHRWAHVKSAEGWKDVPLEFAAKPNARKAFLKCVRQLHGKFLAARNRK